VGLLAIPTLAGSAAYRSPRRSAGRTGSTGTTPATSAGHDLSTAAGIALDFMDVNPIRPSLDGDPERAPGSFL
jgi:hypothetical protein